MRWITGSAFQAIVARLASNIAKLTLKLWSWIVQATVTWSALIIHQSGAGITVLWTLIAIIIIRLELILTNLGYWGQNDTFISCVVINFRKITIRKD